MEESPMNFAQGGVGPHLDNATGSSSESGMIL